MRPALVLGAALLLAVVLGLGALAIVASMEEECPDDICPAPAPIDPAPPKPNPVLPVKPKLPKRPWGESHAGRSAGTALNLANKLAVPPASKRGLEFGTKAGVHGPKHPDGTEISCDYPGARHRKNTASKGLGNCVFTSLHHAADWQDVVALLEFPRYLIDNGIPGGGYPDKVAKLIKQMCKDRNMPEPEWFQVEDTPDKVIPIMQAASRTGRMVCVTYSISPTGRYGGQRVAHMVNSAHCDENWVTILDNNYIGENAYEWVPISSVPRVCESSGGRIWVVILSAPPPPPAPHNGSPSPTPRIAEQGGCPARGASCDCGCLAGQPCRCAGAQAVSAEADAAPDRDWSWSPASDNADWLRLWERTDKRNDYWTERGVWVISRGVYLPRITGGYGEPAAPPVSPPRNYGIRLDKLGQGPRYERQGVETTREQVLAAVSSTVPDDAMHRRLTVIGSQADTAAFSRDWAGSQALAQHKDVYICRVYEPGHWHVQGLGFQTGGRPTIYVQDHTGKVLARMDDYPGPDELGVQLRRLRPDYDPARDPNPLRRPILPGPLLPGPRLGALGEYLWLGAGAALVLTFLGVAIIIVALSRR